MSIVFDYNLELDVIKELAMDDINNSLEVLESTKEPKTLTGCKYPYELLKYMKSNIRYANFSKLKSPEQVLSSKCGSCHDQVMLELYVLRKMGLKPKAKFLIEYCPGKSEGGTTHSFVYYEEKGKLYYFENACGGKQGLRTFKNYEELKNFFIIEHEKGSFGNVKKFPKITFESFGKHDPGETLEEFVNKILR